MTREDVQPAWEKIVEKGMAAYETLTRNERVWFNVEPLTTDGLFDHYMNNGAEHNEDTITDLEYLGFENLAELMREFNALFKYGVPPIDIDERNDEIGSWDGVYDDIIDRMDNVFWDNCAEVEGNLLQHIINTGIGE